MIKKLLLGLVLTGGIVSSAMLPAAAQVYLNVHLGDPPPVIYEAAPPLPGPDYEWHQGYWERANDRWVWRHGHYDRRPYRDARWVPGHRDHDGYYTRGHWSN